MNSSVFKILKISLLGIFSILLFNHLDDFEIKYFKYASSYLINKYHLEKFYYFMIFVEATSILILLFDVWFNWLLRLYDFLLSIYIVFLVICLVCIKEVTNGCIDCHFVAQAFFKDYSYTLYTIVSVGLLYLFCFRPLVLRKMQQKKDGLNGSSIIPSS